MFWPWMIELTGFALSCFTLSRLTNFPDASLVNQTVLSIHYSRQFNVMDQKTCENLPAQS